MKKLLTLITALTLCLGIAPAQADSHSESVVLINTFTVPTDMLDDTIKMWETARDFLDDQPGYVSTKLHQSLAADAKYRLVNVAEWESVETYTAATSMMRDQKLLPRIEGVLPRSQLYSVIRD